MCGSPSHFKRQDCPEGNTTGEWKKKRFFLDMWAHRPHTKKSNREVSISQTIHLYIISPNHTSNPKPYEPRERHRALILIRNKHNEDRSIKQKPERTVHIET